MLLGIAHACELVLTNDVIVAIHLVGDGRVELPSSVYQTLIIAVILIAIKFCIFLSYTIDSPYLKSMIKLALTHLQTQISSRYHSELYTLFCR